MMAKKFSRLEASAVFVLLVVVLFGAGVGSSRAASSADTSGANVTCAFSNPAYSGWCRANVAVPKGKTGQSACQGVLACLNDTHCTKTYCEATTTRGGWKLEKVEPASSSARP